MPNLPNRWKPVAMVLACALVLSILEAISLHAYRQVRGPEPISWARALIGTLPSWLVIAALVWPVRLLARAFPLRPGRLLRHLPVHLAATAGFFAASTAGAALAYRGIGLIGDEPFHAAFVRIGYTYLAYQVLIYWAIVGGWHALDYHAESERRERERAALAASLTEARLQALRSQLDPHFFFNTLNAISTFALQGKPEQVASMVASLGDLMRVCVNDSLPHEVPLSRELEFLELYLDIQRARFPDWLSIERRIDAAAASVLVPSLILQPLIENAIVHGAHDPDATRRVRLTCALREGALAVEVRNTSAGAAGAARANGGVGLRNTRARLEQLHPGAHDFRAGPSDAGWVVSFRLPARHAAAASGDAR